MVLPPGTPRWIRVFVIAAIATAAIAITIGIILEGEPTDARDGSAAVRPAPEEPRPSAAPVPAPGAVGSRPARAAQLVAAARTAVASGDLAQAHEQLAEAYELAPASATLLELARVDFQMGRCRQARRAAQVVLDAARGSLVDEARDLLGRIGRCD